MGEILPHFQHALTVSKSLQLKQTLEQTHSLLYFTVPTYADYKYFLPCNPQLHYQNFKNKFVNILTSFFDTSCGIFCLLYESII